LAFQIVDDLLDFTSSADTLGKPSGSDLRSGNLTAPVLYALEEKPFLEVLVDREFTQADDLEQALDLVANSQGMERSRDLAAHHAQLAVQHLAKLPPSTSREALFSLKDYVLSRAY
jgi:all-trans-nonaprenyl-diphosphate synthase